MSIRSMLLYAALVLAAPPAIAQDSPQALQDAFMAAVRAHDADALASLYTEDAVNFPLDRLVGTGPPSARAAWAGFFGNFRVLEAELRQQHLETHGGTAIAWGLFRILAEPRSGGEPAEFLGRYMDVARNFDGRWLYVADHASLPLPAQEPGDS